MHVHWIICHYEEIFAEYKSKWSHVVLFQTNKVLDKIIHWPINVHLHFDIGDIGQPFHRRHSLLAPKGRFGNLTKFAAKSFGHLLAADLGGHCKSCVWLKFIHSTLNTLYRSHLKISSIPIFNFCSRNYKCVARFIKQFLPKIAPKGRNKRNFNQLKHKAFSVSLMHAREVWKRGTRHKGQFQLVQSTVNELYFLVWK